MAAEWPPKSRALLKLDYGKSPQQNIMSASHMASSESVRVEYGLLFRRWATYGLMNTEIYLEIQVFRILCYVRAHEGRC